jgi:hypothetical protein
MKFETKVKSIIENCECGEINGAYFIDLTKIRKMEIMEVIGNHINYLERYSRDCDEETEWDYSMKFKTFCKAFQIENDDEVADWFVEGFNEGGCDIAYRLESNENVLLVLTDDERYTNSFIQYSPSQQTEEESSENIGFDETTSIQYEIMTNDQKTKTGYYVPSFDELIAEAPCEAMATAWKEVIDLIERTKDSEFSFDGFTFRCVYTHKKKDGSYTIYQHGYPEDWTVEQCRENLLQWFEDVESSNP